MLDSDDESSLSGEQSQVGSMKSLGIKVKGSYFQGGMPKIPASGVSSSGKGGKIVLGSTEPLVAIAQRPLNFRSSQGSVPEDLPPKYPHYKRMYRSSEAAIRESRDLYKKIAAGSTLTLQDLAQSVQRLDSSKPSDTMGKHGMSASTLHAFSCTAKGAMNASLTEKSSTVYERIPIPVDGPHMAEYARSWQL